MMLPTMHVVAPMSPSPSVPFFGAFVPVITNMMRANGWQVDERAVVPARSLSPLARLQRHMTLAWRLIRLAVTRPRLLYIHSPAWFSVLILALMPRKAFYVVNIHGSEIHGRTSIANIFWPFARRLIRGADLIVSPSRAFVDRIVEATGADRAKFVVSPSGGYEACKFYFKPQIGNDPVIGYVSRITQKKGWRDFLAIYDILKVQYPTLKAVVIGEGPERKLLEQELTRRADGNIAYLGAQPQSDLQRHYACMNVFVFTSQITGVDTLGLVSIEAQACGVPLVATDSAITREYVTVGKNGFLATPGDVEDFAAKIKDCLNWDMEQRASIAASARIFETRAVGAELTKAITEAMRRRPLGGSRSLLNTVPGQEDF